MKHVECCLLVTRAHHARLIIDGRWEQSFAVWTSVLAQETTVRWVQEWYFTSTHISQIVITSRKITCPTTIIFSLTDLTLSAPCLTFVLWPIIITLQKGSLRLWFVKGRRFILTGVSHNSLAAFWHELRFAHLIVTGNLALTRFFDGLVLFGEELVLGTVEGTLFQLFVIFFCLLGNLDSWAEGALLHFLDGFTFFELDRVLLQFVLFMFLGFGQSLLSLQIYLA